MFCIKKWNIGKINHVAIATPDIEKTSTLFRDVLGAKVSEKHVSKVYSMVTVWQDILLGIYIYTMLVLFRTQVWDKTIFNNILVISCSILLVEETRVPR